MSEKHEGSMSEHQAEWLEKDNAEHRKHACREALRAAEQAVLAAAEKWVVTARPEYSPEVELDAAICHWLELRDSGQRVGAEG